MSPHAESGWRDLSHTQWLVRTSNKAVIETQPNPRRIPRFPQSLVSSNQPLAVLNAALGIAMGLAVLANIALILRFLQVRFCSSYLTSTRLTFPAITDANDLVCDYYAPCPK